MNNTYTIIGLIMLVLGLGMFFGGFMGSESYSGQLATDENLENVSMYNAMCSAGLIIGIIGFIILLVGVSVDDNKKQAPPVYQQPYQQPYQQQYQQPPQVQPAYQQPITPQAQIRYCPSCSKAIPIDSKLCPYCGLQQ